MRAIDYVRREFAAMRRHADDVLGPVTVEELAWRPPGTANPLGTTLLHVLSGEDRLVQTILQGRPLLWEADRWDERLGVGALPVRGHDWSGIDTRALRPADIAAYGRVVAAATGNYLEALTDAALDEPVDHFGTPLPRAEVLVSTVIHTVTHVGEIAGLRGVAGRRGRPS